MTTSVEERLARIEEKLDHIINWQENKNRQCNMCESSITQLKIDQGKQGVIVWLFSGIISAVVASVIGFIIKP